MQLCYRCLVLDHDDTVVSSTAEIHWPSFARVLRDMRPDVHWTMEDYFRYNFSPGFLPAARDLLHFTDEELALEQEIWQRDVAAAPAPAVYPGMAERIRRFRDAGGKLCVVSHSHRDGILRDYRANGLPEPDRIYGWELPKDRVKPSPWPLQDIMQTWNLQPADLLVVDDLLPGLQMARSCGVDFLASGWGYAIPEITEAWRAEGVPYLRHVEELDRYLFDESGTEQAGGPS